MLGENLVSDPDFTTFGDASPAWDVTPGTQFETVVLTEDDRNYRCPLFTTAAYLLPDSAATNRLTQTVEINGKAGETFSFSAWSAASSAGLQKGRTYAMRVETIGADGNPELLGTFSFDPYCSYWQFGADIFTLTRDVDEVVVSLIYDYQFDFAGFSGTHLGRVVL